MAAATTLTAISIGMGVAQSGASFIQAAKQKKLQQKAQAEAKKAMAAARQKIDVNYMEGLSIDMTPYEREREAMLSAGAQATDAAQEGEERGAGAVAGKLMAAQQQQQADVSTRQSKQLQDLAKLTAEEDANIASQLSNLDLAEAQGAQQAAADAEARRAAAIQQGFQGLTSAVGTAVEAAPLYGRLTKDPTTGAQLYEDRRGGAEGWRQKLFGQKKRRTPFTAEELSAFYGGAGVNM